MSVITGYLGFTWCSGLPEMLGIPKIPGNTQYFGLPDTRWFSKLNQVGSGIRNNVGKQAGIWYPLGPVHILRGMIRGVRGIKKWIKKRKPFFQRHNFYKMPGIFFQTHKGRNEWPWNVSDYGPHAYVCFTKIQVCQYLLPWLYFKIRCL